MSTSATTPAEPLPREFFWILYLTPPVIALIVEPAVGRSGLGNLLGTLASIVLYTLVVGSALQVSTEAVQRFSREQHVLIRSMFLAVTALLVVPLASWAIMPLLAFFYPNLRGNEWSIVIRGLAIAALYLATGCAFARARNRIITARVRVHEQTRAALEARLQALQARTNPHFLFNSLASVSALVAVDPDRACAVLERLAGLFRYSLDSGTRTSSSLREEVEAVRDYIGVESVRLGDRLTHSLDIDDSLLDIETPPMLLQPLVENAIFHGVEARAGGGSISVTGVREGDQLRLTVQDDGPGLSTRRGAGTSLHSLKTRLELLYGSRASIATAQSQGFTVTVMLPA